jgi:hypothetical protein
LPTASLGATTGREHPCKRTDILWNQLVLPACLPACLPSDSAGGLLCVLVFVVLLCCSGKTTLLAQLMGNQGEVVALDRSHAKVRAALLQFKTVRLSTRLP